MADCSSYDNPPMSRWDTINSEEYVFACSSKRELISWKHIIGEYMSTHEKTDKWRPWCRAAIFLIEQELKGREEGRLKQEQS